MSEIVVSAPGKVIVCGEHAVVYSKTAIASSVGLRTFLRIVPRDDDLISLKLPDIKLEGEWKISDLRTRAESLPEIANPPDISKPFDQQFREQLIQIAGSEGGSEGLAKIAFIYLFMALDSKKNQKGFNAMVTSFLPIGAGLGSSASFSVILSLALLLWNETLNEEEMSQEKSKGKYLDVINSWAYRAEKLIHGNPSGIDNCVSTYGGAIAYVGGKMQPLKSFPPLNFLLTNTRVPRNTYDLVAGVRVRKEKYPKVIDPVLNSMHGISEEFQTILDELSNVTPDTFINQVEIIKKIKELINMNQHLLEVIGVSHPALEQICTTTAKYGLISKLTGAGGGGCALTFIEPGTQQETLNKVIQELHSLGYECFQASVGGQGVAIHPPFTKPNFEKKELQNYPIQLSLSSE